MKRLPFTLDLAKKIQNNEVSGRIITCDNRPVEIMMWEDKTSDNNHIIALVYSPNRKFSDYSYNHYNLNGKWIDDKINSDYDLVLEIDDK